MGAVHQLFAAPPTEPPACVVLTPELADKLRAVNDLTRALRAAGIQVLRMDLPNSNITIDATSVGLLSNTFGREMRGLMSRAEGGMSRLRTTVRGVDVVWYTPGKEQNNV